MYDIADPKRRAVGFKLSEGMDVPEELAKQFKFARQKSKLAGTIRGSYFVIKPSLTSPAAEMSRPHARTWDLGSGRARPGHQAGAPSVNGASPAESSGFLRPTTGIPVALRPPMKTHRVEIIPRRLSEVLAALALAACAADVESAPGQSLEQEDVGMNRMGLSIGGAIPKCKENEVLCCPNGGPNCTCLPEGHTCTGGFVVSPGFRLAP